MATRMQRALEMVASDDDGRVLGVLWTSPAQSFRNASGRALRIAIDAIGEAEGCAHCRRRPQDLGFVKSPANGWQFVPNHNPPVSEWDGSSPFVMTPHCGRCSAIQGYQQQLLGLIAAEWDRAEDGDAEADAVAEILCHRLQQSVEANGLVR